MLNKIRMEYRNKSLGVKLNTSLVVIIFLLTIAITCWGNISYKKSINNSQNENTNQIITQVNKSIDFYVQNTENIIDYLSKDPRVLNFFKDNKVENSDLNDPVYNSIYTYTTSNPEIAGIMIVNKNGGYISDVMNEVSKKSLVYEKWYKKASENPEKTFIQVKPTGRNIDNIFKYASDEVFSMYKAIVDKETEEVTGVILIDVNLDVIKNIIENAKPGTAGFIYIMDDNYNIVYTPVNKIIYRIDNDWLKKINNEVITKRINGENFQISKVESNYTKWQAVGVFPEEEGLKVIKDIQVKSLIVAVCGLIIAIFFAAKVTKTIVNPIGKLKRLMKKAEEGDLNVYFNTKYNDEIGELGNSFNSMVKEIHNLMTLVKIEEKKKRIAEMNVLQAQIKPHFIYNTLDTIRWMAEDEDKENIIITIEALTKLLRISLSKGKEIIPVKDEIDHIVSYLTIQKIRYEDKVSYDINIDEEAFDYKVEKLILQPLIENAIYHGIKEKRGNGKIIVTGKVENNILYFRIEDNGKGIEEELLNKINDRLTNIKIDKSEIGYGIFNVNERIKIKFGDEYGLHYESTYGEGTVVEVRHPLLQ